MKVAAIIPAAGIGRRFQGKYGKLFSLLNKKPVLYWTIDILFSFCQQIIIAIRDEDRLRLEKLIAAEFKDATKIKIVPGGDTRAESVKNALQYLDENIEIVCVHDGARPLVTHSSISQCIEAIRSGEKAVILAVPVTQTLKIVKDDHVKDTPDRSQFMLAQTPQVFQRKIIEKAYTQALTNITDDAALVEKIGEPVKVIEGQFDNIKLTNPEDMLFAERILEERKK